MSEEPTSFLYPFIEADEDDSAGLLSDLARSARSKLDESRALRTATLERCEPVIEQAAAAMAMSFAQGGRLFAFGNGGSATDAESTVALFAAPPHGRPLPSMSLVADPAPLTALSNDVGFELVFSRQLIAHGRPGDIAMGFSTSGNSPNVLGAFEHARRRGMRTIGLCGYEGAAMSVSDAVQHCIVVRSDSVHRIQEAQDAAVVALWEAVQRHLAQGTR